MKKKIKIIDILCYISTGNYEKLPKKIRYRYGYLYKDFTFDGESLNYISDKDILFGEDITAMLNDEVEILDIEDEFEDIEEIPIPEIESKANVRIVNVEIKLDQLIRNQKKIIERLNNERDKI